MGEMVERVAQALAESCGKVLGELPETAREGTVGLAKAAIEAMREPTAAMVLASRDALASEVAATPKPHPWRALKAGGYRFPTAFKARVRWRAMIDEALR